MSRVLRARRYPLWLSTLALAGVLTPEAATAAPITYTDIASNPANGIAYRRKESATDAIFDAVKLRPFLSFEELFNSPQKPQGAPGVALLDYDRDGDLDIYVPNGPGRANSLYQNRLVQTGQTRFVDVVRAHPRARAPAGAFDRSRPRDPPSIQPLRSAPHAMQARVRHRAGRLVQEIGSVEVGLEGRSAEMCVDFSAFLARRAPRARGGG